MKAALDRFDANLARVRDLHGLYLSLRSSTTGAVDLSDLLRAEIVLAVSAFDAFVHHLTLLGMLEVYTGNRAATDAYDRFQIPLSALHTALTAGGATDWFADTVAEVHSYLAFQKPDKVADAIRLFSPVRLWDEVARVLSESASMTKATLNTIVDRRNKIAHEADIDPVNPPSRWPIDDALAAGAVDSLERIGHALYGTV